MAGAIEREVSSARAWPDGPTSITDKAKGKDKTAGFSTALRQVARTSRSFAGHGPVTAHAFASDAGRPSPPGATNVD